MCLHCVPISMFITCDNLFITCDNLFITCDNLFITCDNLFITCDYLFITCDYLKCLSVINCMFLLSIIASIISVTKTCKKISFFVDRFVSCKLLFPNVFVTSTFDLSISVSPTFFLSFLSHFLPVFSFRPSSCVLPLPPVCR